MTPLGASPPAYGIFPVKHTAEDIQGIHDDETIGSQVSRVVDSDILVRGDPC
jgi:hypothetical protein